MATEKRLIDANALLDLFTAGRTILTPNKMRVLLAEAPIVDAVEVVHGQWVEKYVYDPDPHDRVRYKCSICGRIEVGKEPYCNCGAKMDGVSDG